MITVPVITQVDLPLSDRCNLNCGFCYTKGGHGNSFSQEHIDKVFDWMFSQYNAGATPEQRQWGIRVTIYGGEPLLEWENLKNVVVSKKALAETVGIKLQFSLVTNMTLLTEEKLDWLIANRVGVHPSIDGCQPAQDAERKFADGSGSSAIVYQNAKMLLSKIGGRSCRMTVSPSTVQYLYDSILFMTKEIGFKTVNGVLAGGVEWTDEALATHTQQIEKVTDWWIDEMREGRHWDLYHLRNMFMGIWSGRRMRKLCPSGVSHVGVDTQGNILPCHRFCNLQSTPEYLLGTLETGITNLSLVETIKNYDLAEANKERCKDCPAVLSCHALCLHEMMLAGNGMFEPCEHYCKVWPVYWRVAMRAHTILMAENNDLYLRMYDPKRQQREIPRKTLSGVRGLNKPACSGSCNGSCGETKDGVAKMNVGVDKQVVYDVAQTSIIGMRVTVNKEGKLNFGVQYKWLDSNGAVLRSDVANYSQDMLLAFFSAQGQNISPLAGVLATLIPVGANACLYVAMTKEPFSFRGMFTTVVNGANKWTIKTYTSEELTAKGIDQNVFKASIMMLVPVLTKQ